MVEVTVQAVYIALFGRPADPGGLAFFNEVTRNGADLSPIIGSLANEPEYLRRFDGMSDEEIINSIYQSLFNRDADAEGLAFFLSVLNPDETAQATSASAGMLADPRDALELIAIQIMSGARNEDLELLQCRIDAANHFTAQLDTEEEIAAYFGPSGEAAGRDFIDFIQTTICIKKEQNPVDVNEPPPPDVMPPPPPPPMSEPLAEIDILAAFRSDGMLSFMGSYAAGDATHDGDILEQAIGMPGIGYIELLDAFSSHQKQTTSQDLVIEAPGSANTAGLAIEMIGAAAMLSADSADGFTLLGRDDGDDTITGGRGDDMIEGRGGADTLEGCTGDDTLSGGAGDDLLNGGAGDDVLDGGDGIDTAYYSRASSGIIANLGYAGPDGYPRVGDGDGGSDTLISIENITGSEFDDTLSGNADDNTFSGLGGDDTLYGQNGNDTLIGGDGNDSLSGGNGDDTLDGGAGNDDLIGGSGNDIILGGGGSDNLRGNDGDDEIHTEAFHRIADGGDDFDTLFLNLTGADVEMLDNNERMALLDYRDAPTGVRIELDAIGITAENFEQVIITVNGLAVSNFDDFI